VSTASLREGGRHSVAPDLRGHTQVLPYQAFDLIDIGADLRVCPDQFLPMLAAVVVALGWQAVGWVVARCITLLALPLVALLMLDSPVQTRRPLMSFVVPWYFGTPFCSRG
jgi:hypothetical protein